MRGSTRRRPLPASAEPLVNAVVWIEPGRALIVHGGLSGPAAESVSIPEAPPAAALALADTASRIGQVGQVGHVLVLGTEGLRTALEREIAALGLHPQVICEAVVEGPVDDATLIAALRRLT